MDQKKIRAELAENKRYLHKIAPRKLIGAAAHFRGRFGSVNIDEETGICKSNFSMKRRQNLLMTFEAFDELLYDEAKAAWEQVGKLSRQLLAEEQRLRAGGSNADRAKVFLRSFSREITEIASGLNRFTEQMNSFLNQRMNAYVSEVGSYYYGARVYEVERSVASDFSDLEFGWKAASLLEQIETASAAAEKMASAEQNL